MLSHLLVLLSDERAGSALLGGEQVEEVISVAGTQLRPGGVEPGHGEGEGADIGEQVLGI